MSRETISEQSLVCEGASYDEVFQSDHEPDEGLSWSSEKEASTHFPNKEVGSYDVGEGGEEEVDKGEDESDEGGEEGEGDGDEGNADERTVEVGSSRSPGHTCPFILPSIWIVNNFLPKMMTNIFKNLRDPYQIPNLIPIHLPGKFKKCY